MLDLIKLREGKGPVLVVCATIVAIVGFVGVAYLRASAEASTNNRERVPAANLGQAPASESYNQTYQAKVEEMVTQRMKQFRDEQEQQQKAAVEQQKASLERQEAMVQAAINKLGASSQGATPAGDGRLPAAEASEQYRPTKIYSMKEMSATGSGPSDNFLGSPSDVKSPSLLDVSMPAPAAVTTKAPSDALLIPEAGWIKGRLINGVIGAQTGEFRYTEIKLQGNYFGPNNYTQNLDGCVVTGEATASFPERRFQVKPISLSCTLPNGRNKTWKMSGYVVDAKDGIQGINGTLINNESNKLAASMSAGALESAGAYYNQTGVTSSVSPLTGSISGAVTSPEKYLAGGIVQGAGKGLQENLKDYYELFRSTLQIGGGGEVTVHITSTLELPDGGEAISGWFICGEHICSSFTGEFIVKHRSAS